MQFQVPGESNATKASRKSNWMVLTIISFCVAIAIAIWFVLSSEQKPAAILPAFMARAVQVAPSVLTTAPTASVQVQVNPYLRNDARLGNFTNRAEEVDGRLGAFNQNVTSLMRTNDPAKIDYARLRVSTQCLSTDHGVNATNAAWEAVATQSKLTGAELLLVGNATLAVRQEALARSIKICNRLREGSQDGDAESAAISAQSGFVQFQSIARTLREARDFNNNEVRDAVAKVVSGPMFGMLESLMYNKVDYGELGKSYSSEQVAMLPTLATALVLCRMGDDCDQGGIVTEQLCWQNGICGANTEVAIWANLRARGFDTTALNQFVTRVQQALQSGDMSIFRKPKPSK